MKKTNVLKDNHLFDKVINNGKKVSNSMYSLFYIDEPGLETFQVGISVGKKTGNAPFRNRQKRVVRACVDELHNDIKPKQYVLISRKNACTTPYHDQLKSLRQLFERVK
ncbi:ribonuclease P protein component [Mollicutes bacterium LVI A0039]|nr:ribonuclease P protein component [Mollicutes bacterium LVI A0039]